MRNPEESSTAARITTLVLCVASLYFAKPVLMPLAVATLLAFLLAPVVNAITRRKTPLPVGVTLVVLLLFSLAALAMWGFGTQLRSLAHELPDYKQNVLTKIADLREASQGSGLDRIRQTWHELRGELRKAPAAATNQPPRDAASADSGADPPPEREPVPVVVRGEDREGVWTLPTALGPLLELLATAGFVLVLVIFMLLRKRELRNRVILLFGFSQIPTTTRALDEAAERISRYLLTQTALNGAYGLAAGLSLYFLSVPYALLWGLLAALLRFIPYVGAWVGAVLPFLLSLAVFPGWMHAFLVLGVILVFEVIINLVLEPLLYGQSAGVSEVALLASVAFWTWIWGPVGLALATPLTVCLAVLGKYVPGLSFLGLLLRDDPVMEPPLEFYQRILAMDESEAGEIAMNCRRDHELIDVYDTLFLPALVSARRDQLAHKLPPGHLEYIRKTTGQLIARLGNLEPSQSGGETDKKPESVEVFGVPAQDATDELVLGMLGQVLPKHIRLRAVSAQALSGEILEQLGQQKPRLVCVSSTGPAGWKETRYLIKRIRSGFPDTLLVVGQWGLENGKEDRELLRATGAHAAGSTLRGARNHIVQLLQLAPKPVTLDFPADDPPVTRAALSQPPLPGQMAAGQKAAAGPFS